MLCFSEELKRRKKSLQAANSPLLKEEEFPQTISVSSSGDPSPVPMEKKKQSNFIAAFKAKALAELHLEQAKSENEDEHVEDLYLDKSQKILLQKTK